jgi:hypothetical protein
MNTTRTERYTGPWADDAQSAITNALAEVGIMRGEYIECLYSSGDMRLATIEPDGAEIWVEIVYSEIREQYRVKLVRT